MAPEFRASKGARLLLNNANLSQILTSVSVEATANALDTTVLADSDKTYVSGVRDGSVSYEGLYDGTALSTASTASTGALDATFQSALAASAQPIVSYGPYGDSIGYRARLFRQEQTAYTAGSPANDVVKVSAAAVVSGGQDPGVWLAPLTARTSTGALASVDSGVTAGTTYGGVGHLHMTEGSTIATHRWLIQHSSSSTAWSTLITFSSSTGTTAASAVQRSTVAGSVKQYVRATCSVFTGGTAKSATVAVAFARRGPINL